MEIQAGNCSAAPGIGSWFLRGTLWLSSAAAVSVAQEVRHLSEGLPVGGMMSTPLWLPGEQAPEGMPWRTQELPVTAADFRVASKRIADGADGVDVARNHR